MIIFMDFRARFESIKRAVKLFNRIILSFHVTILVLIVYVDILPENRDLLFDS